MNMLLCIHTNITLDKTDYIMIGKSQGQNAKILNDSEKKNTAKFSHLLFYACEVSPLRERRLSQHEKF